MKLYRTANGARVEHKGGFFPVKGEWDALVNHADLRGHLARAAETERGTKQLDDQLLAPVGSQEVWAAGVTYYRSKSARMEESHAAGGGSFYDRVYDAPRPELFFKAAPWRVRASGDRVRIRRDARWSVPEPEVVLCVNARAKIVGFTIGNDMSSRDIEGENPLYLSQAKIYDGACAIGPAVLVADSLPRETAIELRVTRDGAIVYEGHTSFGQMKRDPRDLVEFLFRETTFPYGAMLFTGTGIVPPDEFTLRSADEVSIFVPPIGTLSNTVDGP
ncbi:MAG: fumarylacetoacetate hydrolase family protein [Gemmatimonadaceae bacterium]